MKKKSIISSILAILLIFIMINSRVYADISVSTSSIQIEKGASTTVSVGSTGAEEGSVNISGGGGYVSVSGGPAWVGGGNSGSFTISGTQAGSTTLTVTGVLSEGEGDNTYTKTINVTVIDNTPAPTEEQSSGSDSSGDSSSGTTAEEGSAPREEPKNEEQENKSNNNSLASITLSEGSLSPAFYRDTLDYSVEFPDDFNLRALKSIHVDAKAEDSKATVEGTGEITLDEGENVIKVTCTAENGTPKTYSLKIVKPLALKVSDLRLTKLELSSINTKGDSKPLDLKLENDKFEYKVEVEDDITDVNVVTEAEKGIRISTKGGKNLSNGSNLIEITLTSEQDETVQTSYVIRVVKKEKAAGEKVDEEKINKRNKIIGWILVGFIVFMVVAIIAMLIILKKKKKDTIEYKKNKTKFADDDEIKELEEESDYSKDEFANDRNDIFKDDVDEEIKDEILKEPIEDKNFDENETHTKEEWAKLLAGEELPKKDEVEEKKVEEPETIKDDILDKELDEDDILRNAEKSKAILEEYMKKHGRSTDEPKVETPKVEETKVEEPKIEEKKEDYSGISALFKDEKDEDEFDISKLERKDENAVVKDMTEEEIPESLRADKTETDDLANFEQNPEIEKILNDESTFANIEDAHVDEKDMMKRAKEEIEKDKYYHSDLDKKLRDDGSKDKKDKGNGGRRFK